MSHPLSPDVTPEAGLSELNQDYPMNVTGEMHVRGPVQTHELPSRIGISRTYSTDDATVMPVVGEDRRRKRIVILGISVNGQTNAATGFYIGNREDVRTGLAAFWPVGLPLEIRSTEQLFVRAATLTSPSTVAISIIAENWAE